jgi:hypothetical protein
MQILSEDGGPATQGAIALNVVAIARVLSIVGPVTVPGYNQVVTAANLEDVIRQYTENPTAVLTVWHDKFTIQLGHAFMDKLHGLPPSQLMAIAQAMLTSLRAKDIQVYLSDKTAEALVAQQGFDGAITHGSGDGLTVADDNVSVNKGSAVTTVTYTDAVTLDASGTATHHLTITYDFNTAKDPAIREFLFGADWYLTYLRIYTPPAAHLASQSGFNWDYSHLQLTTSDDPNRTMWGGYVYVRDGKPYSLNFVWSVPGVATKDAAGHLSYSLTTQHQSGMSQQLHLTISAAGAATPLVSYNGALDQDRTFTLPTGS